MQLCLLGRFELIDLASGDAIAVQSKKTRALLAILAAAPRMTVSRARLAALLWSQSLDEQARQSLRQLLSTLRRAPEPLRIPIVFDESDVGLDCDAVAVDVASVLGVPDTASLTERTRRIAAYRGPFGIGLDIGEPEFDDWLRNERQRINESVVPVMDQLVRDLAKAGRHQDALAQANVLHDVSPFREETHRLIIAQEAIVSGRASAMKRYEDFRILLRDELAVRPEPATQQLIDQLRKLSSPSARATEAESIPVSRQPDGPPVVSTPSDAAPETPAIPHPFRFRAAIVACLALAAIAVPLAYRQTAVSEPSGYFGEADGRVAVDLLPFDASGLDPSARDLAARDLAATLHREALSSFSRNSQVSLLDALDHDAARQGSRGKPLPARYLVRTRLSGSRGRVQADVHLMDSATRRAIWSATMPVADLSPSKFARELHGAVTSEIVLGQAREFAANGQTSSTALLWRARAAQLQTRLGVDDQSAIRLYQAVLDKEPNNLLALLGLSECFILRVARNQTKDRAGDVAAASELLTRAKPQIPNSADIAFKEAMLNKLQGNFERASSDFHRAMQLDPAHWNAAAQYAHVMIFLGRLDDGFALMETAARNLLPDLGVAETAYIAGETALAAGQADIAVHYLGMAVGGNSTVGRIHALYAAALELAGRPTEAQAAARQADRFSPDYTPELMALRGGPRAHPRYVAARDRMVEAFRTARSRNQEAL